MAVDMTMVDKTLIRTGKSPSYYFVFVTQRLHEKRVCELLIFFVTQRLHENSFPFFFFRNTTVQDAPSGPENTRCDTNQ